MNILAFGAHPDDIEVFCYGTLMKYHAAGHRIFVALTTSGNTGSNLLPSREAVREQREREQLSALAPLGAQARFLRFDDEGLEDTAQTRRAVLTAIRWADPDIIFTNPPWDGSTDHAMTGTLVTRMQLSVGGKLHPADLPPISKRPHVFFWTTACGVNFHPKAYVDISDCMEQKCEALYRHASQYDWMKEFSDEDFCDSMRGTCRMYGVQAGCKYAEGFVGHQIEGQMADYRLLP